MQRYKNYNRQIWIVLRSISTVALTLGLLGIAGCGWLFSQPESPLSEEEAKAILTTFEEGSKLYERLMEEGDPDPATKVADWMRSAPGIANAVAEEDGSVYVTYKCGLTGLIVSPFHMATSIASSELPYSITQQAERKFSLSSVSPQLATPCSPGIRKAVIFALNEEWYNEFGTKVKADLETMNYEVEVYYGKEFNLARVQRLNEYEIIVFITHGEANPDSGVWLVTGEFVTLEKLREAFKPEIGVTSLAKERGYRFMFNQDFIISQNIRFPNSLVIAMACESLKEDRMARVFCDHGAAAFLGWTDSTSGYFLKIVLDNLFDQEVSKCGWSLSRALSYRFKWNVNDRIVTASLMDVFCNSNLPPRFRACYDKPVEESLPALGWSKSREPPIICLRSITATPFLKWEGSADVVLYNPPDPALCKALLDISFSPTSVPFEISSVGGPGWFFTVTISEKNGFKVTLYHLQIEYYDTQGNLLAQWHWDERVFFRLFKTNTLDPYSSISTKIKEAPRPHYTPAIVVWKVFGIDSNDNYLEVSNSVQLQQNAERGLKVEISPPTLIGDKWQYEVSIFEIRGLETNLIGISVETFDELRWSTARYVGTREDIATIFGTNVISGSGQIKAIVTQPYNPDDRALAWEVAGVDENGTVLYGSGAAELTATSSRISEKSQDQAVKLILPLAPVVKEVQ